MDITEHIEAKKLSRREICEMAGISRAYLSLIEKGLRQVGPEKVEALAASIGVSIADLRPDLAKLFDGKRAAVDGLTAAPQNDGDAA